MSGKELLKRNQVSAGSVLDSGLLLGWSRWLNVGASKRLSGARRRTARGVEGLVGLPPSSLIAGQSKCPYDAVSSC